jgi:6-phosphogluconolactonase
MLLVNWSYELVLEMMRLQRRYELEGLATMERRKSLRRWAVVCAALMLPVFTGCSGFFPPINNGGGGGTATGDYVYVANGSRSSIGGLSISTTTTTSAAGVTTSTGKLSSISGLPFAAGYVPQSMVVTPNNAFLYVGGTSAISLYLINSNGTLTTPSTGAQQVVVFAPSLAVSPDGQWLIALDGTTQQLDIFQINSSTGALTAAAGSPATYTVASGTWIPTSVKVSPNGALIFAALGTGGDAIFTFNTTTGVATSSAYLPTGNVQTSDNGYAIDSTSSYLYIARSGVGGGVAVYTIGNGGTLNVLKGSPFAAGNGTYSLTMDSTGTYLYAANRLDNTISGYTIVPATATAALSLTPLKSSPYQSGTSVQSLGLDNTGKYLLAAAVGGSPDLTMYSFDITVPGQLDPATSIATDADPAGASTIALTH